MTKLKSAGLLALAGIAIAMPLRAQLKLSAPTVVPGNSVQFNLTGASSNAAYVLAQSANGTDWQPTVTGA
ncbi:MAG: hypothetical protein NTZ16_09450, partial [Verrucomicrobia bacterium]|nr:hypothetical protein [Verrucomicrobiota bacterium]